MTTKERIQAEIENLDEEKLEKVYKIIQQITEIDAVPNNERRQPGLLSRLKQIQIEAPADFAENLDEYASGAKHV